MQPLFKLLQCLRVTRVCVRMKTSVCRSQKVITQRANNLLWRSVFRRSRPSWLDCKTHHFNPLFICSIQWGFVSTTSNSLWTLKRKESMCRDCVDVWCCVCVSLLWPSSGWGNFVSFIFWHNENVTNVFRYEPMQESFFYLVIMWHTCAHALCLYVWGQKDVCPLHFNLQLPYTPAPARLCELTQ